MMMMMVEDDTAFVVVQIGVSHIDIGYGCCCCCHRVVVVVVLAVEGR